MLRKVLSKISSNYRSLGIQLAGIYRTYGGFHAFASSPYVHISIILGILSALIPTANQNAPTWNSLAVSILPSIIGMSLAGYALILTFGTKDFRHRMRIDEYGHFQDPTFYLKQSASFTHFLLVQCVCLIFAIITYRIKNYTIIDCIGWSILFYSAFLIVANIIQVYTISKYFDLFEKRND